MQASGKVNSACRVSGVTHQDLYLARREILKAEAGHLLKWSAQEDVKGCMLDNMCMSFD